MSEYISETTREDKKRTRGERVRMSVDNYSLYLMEWRRGNLDQALLWHTRAVSCDRIRWRREEIEDRRREMHDYIAMIVHAPDSFELVPNMCVG